MRILSYSLFRSPSPIYWRNDRTDDRVSAYARFLPALVRAHHAIWPGDEMRIHHDDAVRAHPYFPALSRMHDRGLLRLMPCGDATALTLAMLWRLRPLFDEDDHLVVSCDMDSLPILRLRCTVDEFAASGKAVMVAHGCESHNGVLGGGIAARGFRFRSLVGRGTWHDFIALGGTNWNAYAADEEFLRQTIWPLVSGEAVLFRSPGGSPPIIQCADIRPWPQSTPTDLLPAVRYFGDSHAPYIGSAGYDLDGAYEFYDGLPLHAIRSIRECEGDMNLRSVMHP